MIVKAILVLCHDIQCFGHLDKIEEYPIFLEDNTVMRHITSLVSKFDLCFKVVLKSILYNFCNVLCILAHITHLTCWV